MQSKNKISNNYRRFVIQKLKKDNILKIEEKRVSSFKNEFIFNFYLNKYGRSHKLDYNEAPLLIKQKNILEGQFVYVFVNYFSNVCKIGYSANPIKRLNTIQTGCPFKLKMIVVVKGNRSVEKALHKKYKKYKTNGEWFNYKEELKEAIEKIKNSDRNLVLSFSTQS